MKDNIAWLVTCPCNDVNFKNHLIDASAQEIEAAIKEVKKQQNVKTKLKMLNASLKRKQKSN